MLSLENRPVRIFLIEGAKTLVLSSFILLLILWETRTSLSIQLFARVLLLALVVHIFSVVCTRFFGTTVVGVILSALLTFSFVAFLFFISFFVAWDDTAEGGKRMETLTLIFLYVPFLAAIWSVLTAFFTGSRRQT